MPGMPVEPHGESHDVLRHGPPRAPNEDRRIETVEALGLRDLGTSEDLPKCAELDVLLQAVCKVFKAPYSSVALYVDGRCWLCNTVNTPACELAWQVSACPWNLLNKQPQTLVCGDLLQDARFADQSWVGGENGWRCFVSSPMLASNGHRLGTICFMDGAARTVSANDCRLLNNFAELAVRALERHVKLYERLDYARSAYAAGLARPEDELLVNAFAREQRCEGAGDACVLMIDTGRAGWPIVYCTPTWQAWTGLARDDVLNKPLSDVVEPGRAGQYISWADLQRDVSLGAQFVLARVRTKKGAQCFDISFRPAAVDLLDKDTPILGMPSFVPMSKRATRFYAASLHPNHTNADNSPDTPLCYTSKVTSSERVQAPHAVVPQLIAGVKLHHVLGRGGYGTVYQATWQDTDAVVKVQDYTLNSPAEHRDARLEISLGMRFHHPNIVRTWMHASVGMDNQPDEHAVMLNSIWRSAELSLRNDTPTHLHSPDDEIQGIFDNNNDYDNSSRSQSHSSNSPRVHVPIRRSTDGAYPCTIRTFMILEFCDMGSLQDAVDRGWLRTSRSQRAAMDYDAVVWLAQDVAKGMHALHEADVVHADLTAGNVLLKSPPALLPVANNDANDKEKENAVCKKWVAKVSDFGKARLLGPQGHIHTSSYGTVSYMAPEVLAHGTLSKAADVYAFGVLLWQMCTGSRPWASMSHIQVMSTVMEDTHSLHFPDHVPPALAELSSDCMCRQPEARPTFAAVRARLHQLCV